MTKTDKALTITLIALGVSLGALILWAMMFIIAVVG